MSAWGQARGNFQSDYMLSIFYVLEAETLGCSPLLLTVLHRGLNSGPVGYYNPD